MDEKARVLVVDDNPEDVFLISMILQGAGYEARSAPDLRWGLHVARTERCDVVLLDNRFDGSAETGLDSIRKFRGLSSAGVILMTAFADEKTAQEALLLGAKGFLAKPVEPGTLLSAVSRLLASLCPSPA